MTIVSHRDSSTVNLFAQSGTYYYKTAGVDPLRKTEKISKFGGT